MYAPGTAEPTRTVSTVKPCATAVNRVEKLASEKPQPACRELPRGIMGDTESFVQREETLPEGFELVPTPEKFTNILSTSGGGSSSRSCKRMWHFNPWILIMGPGYRPQPGRLLKVPGDTDHLYLEPAMCAYSFKFHRSMLDKPGVSFGPACVASPDIGVQNALAKHHTDVTISMNQIPNIPPGVFMPYSRLTRAWSLKAVKVPKKAARDAAAAGIVVPTAKLVSKMEDHPILKGERVFPPLKPPPVEPGKKPDTQSTEGSVGYLCFHAKMEQDLLRFEEECSGPTAIAMACKRQKVPIYMRFVFNRACLLPCATQIRAFEAAVDFALSNTPTGNDGSPWVTHSKRIVIEEVEGVTYTKLESYTNVFQVDPGVFGHELEHGHNVNLIENMAHEAVNIMIQQLCVRGTKLRQAIAEALLAKALGETVYTVMQGLKEGKEEGAKGDMSDDELEAALYSRDYTVTIVLEHDDDDDDGEDHAGAGTGMGVSLGASGQCGRGKQITKVYSGNQAKAVIKDYNEAMETARVRKELFPCSPILNDMGPPDPDQFEGRPVIVYGIMLDVKLGYDDKTPEREAAVLLQSLNDLVTRFLWDAMIENPGLSVVSSDENTCMSLFTDKAPGLLGVKTMQASVPAVKTNTSDHRKMKRFSKCLPPGFEIETVTEKPKPPQVGRAPVLTREEVDENVFFRNLIRGEDVPSQVPGCMGSIYVPGTKCNSTVASGTGHSWQCLGALNFHCAMTPWTPQTRFGWFEPSVPRELVLKSMEALGDAFYNATRNQIWLAEGYWKNEEAYRRTGTKAYGMDCSQAHSVMGWCSQYPAWPQDATDPKAIRIWDLKFVAEAAMQWNLRYGRVLRHLLANHKRKIREDIARVIFPNYHASTRRRGLLPLAPVLDVYVSVYVAYSNRVVLGKGSGVLSTRASAQRKSSGEGGGGGSGSGGPGDPSACEEHPEEDIPAEEVYLIHDDDDDDDDDIWAEFGDGGDGSAEEESRVDEDDVDVDLDMGSLALDPEMCGVRADMPLGRGSGAQVTSRRRRQVRAGGGGGVGLGLGNGRPRPLPGPVARVVAVN
jgi:hypothetical protein